LYAFDRKRVSSQVDAAGSARELAKASGIVRVPGVRREHGGRAGKSDDAPVLAAEIDVLSLLVGCGHS
jgi:hypothetical protein